MGHGEREHAETEGEGGHENRTQADTHGLFGGVDRILALFHVLLGEFHDQNGVLAHQTDRREKADLEVDVVGHAERAGEAEGAHDAAGHHEEHRDRDGPAFIKGGKAEEHHEDREREERGTLVACGLFLVRNAVPGDFVAGGEDFLGDFLNGGHGLTGGDARTRVALDVHGGKAVEAFETRAAVGPFELGERADGHHLAVGIANVPAEDVFGLHARARVAHDPDLLDAAAVHVVVDVGAGEDGRDGGVDFADAEVEGRELFIVEHKLQLRRVGHAVVADHRQTRVGIGLHQELAHVLHELVVRAARVVLDVEVEAVGHAEFGNRRKREDESAGLLEVRVAHEDAHGAALDGGDRRVGRRALAPVAKLQEAQSHVLARTCEGEAADHEDGLDGLGFGLGERLLDLLHLKVGALERRAVGELGHHHEDALVFLRHERGRQRLEAPDHQADDGGVGDEHDAPAVDRLGDEGLDGLCEGVEAAVEPAEEAALAVVLLMVDRLEHRGAEGRRQRQGDDDGKRHGRDDGHRELAVDDARGAAEEGHRHEHGRKDHGDAHEGRLDFTHRLDGSGLRVGAVLAHHALDVLHDHDGVVHQ